METFTGFLSYARADQKADPKLVRLISDDLADRVSVRLANAEFKIWKDEKDIRTGDAWSEELDKAVRGAHVLIVLLSPKWVESEWCRKEYDIFCEGEPEIGVGGYVVPILIRDVEKEKDQFDETQRQSLKDVHCRQFCRVLASDFLTLKRSERLKIIDQIADDIEGMVRRLRSLREEKHDASAYRVRPRRTAYEFSGNPRNFNDIDFVRCADVEMHPDGKRARLLTQFDFVEKLYVETEKGNRVEFGVQRADLKLTANGKAKVQESRHLRENAPNVAFVAPQDDERGLVISIDPPQGKTTLGEAVLPPGPDDGANYLSEIATVSDVAADEVRVELSVSLNVEGIQLPGAQDALSRKAQVDKLAAIIEIAAKKHGDDPASGKMIRPLKVEEKE